LRPFFAPDLSVIAGSDVVAFALLSALAALAETAIGAAAFEVSITL
jgi:hypothetical protein